VTVKAFPTLKLAVEGKIRGHEGMQVGSSHAALHPAINERPKAK
jgi:hypothetical protein